MFTKYHQHRWIYTILVLFVQYWLHKIYIKSNTNENIVQTKPELSIKISKSSPVVIPVEIEIHTTVSTSLKYLNNTTRQQGRLLFNHNRK